MRTWTITALIALATHSVAVAGSPPEAASARFQPIDVFGLAWAGDPQARPDGGAIAYVRSVGDIMTDRAARSIWLIDAATGLQSPMTMGPLAVTPRWSPDGRRLAYVALAAEGGAPQLFVRWMASGVAAKVADLPRAPSDIAWSPDGARLAFTMISPAPASPLGAPVAKPDGARWAEPLQIINRLSYRADGAGYLQPGYRHVWLVSADGGAPRQLTYGAVDDGGSLDWTPNGESILFSADRAADWEHRPEQSDVWRVAVRDGVLTQLTHQSGPARHPVMSPDGRRIAFVGFPDAGKPYQDQTLYLMDADGGHLRGLTPGLDRPLDSPHWAADSGSVYVEVADHGATRVARVFLDGRIEPVVSGLAGEELDRPYGGGAFSVARNGLVAFTAGDWSRPPEIAVATAGKSVRRLTGLNEDLLYGKVLATVSPLSVASSFDHQPIDAWMATPPGYDPARKYPLILEIHGGPYAAYGSVWASEVQLYAAAGYVVVYANPRGSTSYGQAFADGIAHDYPGHDFDDLMSVVDAAITKGPVDAKNLFVTGGSGGGLLTAWTVGKTSRFRAAVSQKPVIDWVSFSLTTDMYLVASHYWFDKPAWEDPREYWRRSPLSLVGSVKTPTLVMVGDEDHRTPPGEAEQFYQALQILGVPTTLIRVPGASHGGYAERPSQLTAEVAAILAWFERYKAPGA